MHTVTIAIWVLTETREVLYRVVELCIRSVQSADVFDLETAWMHFLIFHFAPRPTCRMSRRRKAGRYHVINISTCIDILARNWTSRAYSALQQNVITRSDRVPVCNLQHLCCQSRNVKQTETETQWLRRIVRHFILLVVFYHKRRRNDSTIAVARKSHLSCAAECIIRC